MMPSADSFLRPQHQEAARLRDSLMESLPVPASAFDVNIKTGQFFKDPKAARLRTLLVRSMRMNAQRPSFGSIARVLCIDSIEVVRRLSRLQPTISLQKKHKSVLDPAKRVSTLGTEKPNESVSQPAHVAPR